jgi:hypothetical protein
MRRIVACLVAEIGGFGGRGMEVVSSRGPPVLLEFLRNDHLSDVQVLVSTLILHPTRSVRESQTAV